MCVKKLFWRKILLASIFNVLLESSYVLPLFSEQQTLSVISNLICYIHKLVVTKIKCIRELIIYLIKSSFLDLRHRAWHIWCHYRQAWSENLFAIKMMLVDKWNQPLLNTIQVDPLIHRRTATFLKNRFGYPF